MTRRGTTLAALVLGGAFMLTMVGVVVAESPSPDPSASAPASEEPTASAVASPSATPSEPAEPSAAASRAPAAPEATASVPPKSAATPAPAKTTELPDADEADEVTTTMTGTLTTKADADGDVNYYIGDVELSAGPPWFWGDKHPLAGLVGKSVTVTGHLETGNPAKAKAKSKDSGPEFEVLTVNGKTIREPGKPPWAGGPKVVGPSHPGYAGWSKNHGNGNGNGNGNGAKSTVKP